MEIPILTELAVKLARQLRAKRHRSKHPPPHPPKFPAVWKKLTTHVSEPTTRVPYRTYGFCYLYLSGEQPTTLHSLLLFFLPFSSFFLSLCSLPFPNTSLSLLFFSASRFQISESSQTLFSFVLILGNGSVSRTFHLIYDVRLFMSCVSHVFLCSFFGSEYPFDLFGC